MDGVREALRQRLAEIDDANAQTVAAIERVQAEQLRLVALAQRQQGAHAELTALLRFLGESVEPDPITLQHAADGFS